MQPTLRDLLTSIDRLLLELGQGVPPEQELIQHIERLVTALRQGGAGEAVHRDNPEGGLPL